MGIYDDYPDGIKGYSNFNLTTTVYFPKNDVRCVFCKFCIYNRNTTSSMCAVTGDILYVPNKGVGIGCPLESVDGGEK